MSMAWASMMASAPAGISSPLPPSNSPDTFRKPLKTKASYFE